MIEGVCGKVCRQESEQPVSVSFYVCLLLFFCLVPWYVRDVLFVQDCVSQRTA